MNNENPSKLIFMKRIAIAQVFLLLVILIALLLSSSCSEHTYEIELIEKHDTITIERIDTIVEEKANITLDYIDNATLAERNTYNYWRDRADTLSKEIYRLNNLYCTSNIIVPWAEYLKNDYLLYVDKLMAMYDLFIYQYEDGYKLCNDPTEAFFIEIEYNNYRLMHSMFKERRTVTLAALDGIM